jgi:hypothetical protein
VQSFQVVSPYRHPRSIHRPDGRAHEQIWSDAGFDERPQRANLQGTVRTATAKHERSAPGHRYLTSKDWLFSVHFTNAS